MGDTVQTNPLYVGAAKEPIEAQQEKENQENCLAMCCALYCGMLCALLS
jgi:hypothetical protein